MKISPAFRFGIMRVPFRIALLPALFFVSVLVSHASAAAVMSIDLGSEWMKVSWTILSQRFD